MNHYQRIKSLLLLLVMAASAMAQIENGKVYNFVNVGNNTQSLVVASNNRVSIAATDHTDFNQLWYVSKNSDNSYSLRNLGSGRYLRSSNNASVMWTMVNEIDANCKFSCTTAGSGYTFRATNTHDWWHYMHYGANEGKVVGWESGAEASQWTITTVSVSNETLNQNWDELVSIDPSPAVVASYQNSLSALFADKACTTLKDTYASMSESTLKSQAAYQNLPIALQNMVLKVRNNSWSEGNYDASKSSWDGDYAKKYRVQLYEPYNEPEAAASALGINAHTNLNNPTGIFAGEREVIYVMVEGTVKEGASLYIASYTGNGKPGSYDEGVELKEGLNVIPSFVEGNNYVINYVVHTFDTSKGKGNKAKARRLSDYDGLKIHIEGGYINGYWNKMGDELYAPDTNESWEYVEARATQTTATILGEYITMQFPLRDADATGDDGSPNRGLSYYLDQVDVKEVIDEWDDIMMWERFLLGLLDRETTTDKTKNVKSPYSDSDHVVEYTGDDVDGYAADYGDYYNVHGLSLGVGYNYMYGGWDHCGYNFNTMQSIIVDMLTSAGSHWGPGHEIGHQHQGLLNLNGLTEVTNNLFSNVVLWYFGETTSRYNGNDAALSNVLAAFNTEGSDFYTNNIWGQTHMYYKLFMYYHVLGHNPKFYPRLFEMLRQDPMINGGQIDGATSLLHFYKKCCLASGDDLTEFFRAHGFFRVMTDRLVGDYANAIYNMTQVQIDEAIAEVKSWNYNENIAVLFINDATGETIKSHKGDNLELYGETTICAEVGGYASFASAVTPEYTYNVVGNTVTMMGEGGAGFAIFDDKSELIAFSDKKTFHISDACVAAIAAEKASIIVVKGDNTLLPAIDVMNADDAGAKYAALGELLTAVTELLAYSDADNTKPGFYKASELEALKGAYENALTVYENKVSNSYAATYGVLSQEYANALEADKTPFLPGSTYVLTNKRHSKVSMTLNGTKLMGVVTNMSSSAQQWTFEPTGEKDTYYLKNVGGSYLGSLLQSTQVGVTTRDLASRYKLFDMGDGLWALQCQNDALQSLHCDAGYKIVGWSHTSTNDDGSWWYLTATAKDESMLPLYDLQNLIKKTETLVLRMTTSGGAIDERYQNFITADGLQEANEQILIAQQKCNLGMVSVYDIEILQAQYDILFEAYQNANDVEFNAKKEELLTLISSTHSLINSCGTVTYTPGNVVTPLTLQTTNPNGENYLSTNAQETNGTHYLSNLLDYDNANNHFHSAWSWDVNEVHHLKVDLGNGKSLDEFTFTYRTAARPYPYEIKVYGSNDDVYYSHLTTFTKDDSENRLPTTTADNDAYKELWTSSMISSNVAYRYLRFDVTNSGGTYNNSNPFGEYCFTMSYFGITMIGEAESYTVELTPDAGDVTEELLLATYKAAQEAEAIANRGNTEKQLQEAIDALHAQKMALYIAKYPYIEYAITIFGGNDNGGVVYNEASYTATLVAAATLTVEELSAIELDGYIAAITLEGTIITVTYTLDKSDYEALYDEALALIHSCYVDENLSQLNYINSAFINEEVMNGFIDAANNARNECAGAATLSEYEAAKEAMRNVIAMLEETKGKADTEAEERNRQRAILYTLIGDAETLVTRCKENPGDATETLIAEMREAIALALVVADNMGSTKEQLGTETDALQAEYDVLSAAQQSTAKADLRALIAQTAALIAQCGEITIEEKMTQEKMVLQTTDENASGYLYCNAPYLADPNSGDYSPASEGYGILDGDYTTFLHSDWSNNAPSEDHYLRVSLGNIELSQFILKYSTRGAGGDVYPGNPKRIVVEGSNTVDGHYNEIATLTSLDGNGLPQGSGLSHYTSAVLDNSSAYKFIRFRVVENESNRTVNGHCWFYMSEFALMAVGYTSEYVVAVAADAGSVTEEQLLEVFMANNAAEVLAEESAVQTELVEERKRLQVLYDELLKSFNTFDTKLPMKKAIDNEVSNEESIIYDLHGRRLLGVPASGLYIINGVKRYVQLK